MPTADVTGGVSARRWQAFAVCLAAGFMTLLDVSIVNVALPSIESALHASSSQVQWIVAGYTLAFGLVLVPAGRLGDLHGRRVMFLVGLGVFVLTSALCGAALSGTWLVIGRVLQGVAAGMLNPQVIAMIQELFSGAERARAFGMYGACVGISTAVGPLLGGVLIEVFGAEQGWRAVFLVNVPVGLVTLGLAWRLLPRVRPHGAERWLDLPGLLLLGGTVLVFMLPFVAGQGASSLRWLLVLLSIVGAVAFWRWGRRYERSGRRPVFTAGLLGTATYSRGAVFALLYFGGFTSIFLLSTLYLQSGLGLTALQCGLVLTPFALAGAVSAWLSGRWVSRFGRRLVIVGVLAMLAGVVAADVIAVVADGATAAWWIGGVLAISGFGNGIVIAPNQALTLADVPVSEAGVAAGALQTGQRIGTAVGLAASTSVFFATVASTGGDFSHALALGLRVVIGVLLVALVVAVVDQWRRWRTS